ncbi:hypothetical protein [Sphingosinicella sp. BN140058]|uniref:hypothetical protein n=1 Tax=Sphingosinicella sp. BN140058 TaxID=1892855 RepID=UPI0010108B40|nr:hypothetical protein [Sphingosinicella sp. BN140058]QAY76185.1 hypothetical protein ETR14_06315 [Sphingosinicella sp. BN140058]
MSGVALWLLLLSIFTHAFGPLPGPVSGTTRSAFSAFTDDVSLAPASPLSLQKSARLRAGSGDGDDADGVASSDGIALLVVVLAGIAAFGLARRAQIAARPLGAALRQAGYLPLGARAPPAF